MCPCSDKSRARVGIIYVTFIFLIFNLFSLIELKEPRNSYMYVGGPEMAQHFLLFVFSLIGHVDSLRCEMPVDENLGRCS